MNHDAARERLGALALGGPGDLGTEERTELEAHLRSCPACRDELAGIAPLAAPLARIAPEPGSTGPTGPTTHPSPAGFAAIADRIREEGEPIPTPTSPVPPSSPGTPHTAATPYPVVSRLPEGHRPRRRPRRRPRLLAAAAVTAVALAGLGVGGVLGARVAAPDADPVPVEALAPGVTAGAGTIAHTWGLEVVLTGSGFAPGRVYEVAVLDRGGRAVPAGAFVGTGPAEMVCRLNSPVLPADAGGFVVTDVAGGEILRSRFG